MELMTNDDVNTNITSLVLKYLETATQDMEQWLALLHTEVVIEFPYAESAGLPRQLTGKETIRTVTEGFLQTVPGIRFINPVVYPSLDPHMAFATYVVSVNVPATNKVYNQTYIAAFTESKGKIVRMAEYYDPTKITEAFN